MTPEDRSSYAYNHTGLDVDPSYVSDPGFRDFALSRYGQRAGLSVPQGDGFLKEFGRGIAQNLGRAGRGVAKAAAIVGGNEEGARNIESAHQASLQEAPWKAPLDYGTLWDNLTNASYMGRFFGGVVGDTIPFLGTGMTGNVAGKAYGGVIGRLAGRGAAGERIGAKVGQFTAQLSGSMATQFGDDYINLLDEAKANGVELTGKQAYTSAMFKSAINGIVELGLGGQEAQLVRNGMRTMARDTIARETLEQTARAGFFGKWFGSANWLTRTAATAGGEGLEEIMQGVNDLAWDSFAAGKSIDFTDSMAQLAEAGVMGFVGGLPFGGLAEAGRLSSQRKWESMPADLTEAEEAKVVKFLGADGLKKSNEAFAAFQDTLPSDFKNIAPIIRNVAFKMALETGKKPEDYINQLKTVFLNEENLPPQRRAAFFQELMAKPGRTSEMLAKYFKDYDHLVKSTVTQGRIRDMKKSNDFHSEDLAKRGFKPIDANTEQGAVKVGTIARWARSVVGDMSRQVRAGEAFRISRAKTMEFVNGNHDLAREWYIHGSLQNVEIGSGKAKGKYDIYLTEQGAVFIPSGDVAVAQSESDLAAAKAAGLSDTGSQLELAKELRRHKRIAHATRAVDGGWDDFRTLLGHEQQEEVMERIREIGLRMADPEVTMDEDDLAFYDKWKTQIDGVTYLAKAELDRQSLADTKAKLDAAAVVVRQIEADRRAVAAKERAADEAGLKGAIKKIGAKIGVTGALRGQPVSAEVEADLAADMSEEDLAAFNYLQDMIAAENANAAEAARRANAWLVAKEGKLEADGKKAEAKRLHDAFTATRALPEPEGGREGMTEQGTLFQAKKAAKVEVDDMGIRGLYDPRAKLAAFFSKADAGTVIHEWLHHVVAEDILPDSVSMAFKKAYGQAGGEDAGLKLPALRAKYPQASEAELLAKLRWNQAAEENLAQSFILWIRDGRAPQNVSEDVLEAFGTLQKQFKSSWASIKANYTAQDVQKEAKFQINEALIPTADELYPYFLKKQGGRTTDTEAASRAATRAVAGLWGRGMGGEATALAAMKDLKMSEERIAEVMRLREEMTGAAYQAAYHGTPHVWSPEPGFPRGRPRLDKIGSGEGAQAYGWGIYFAENKEVGDWYAKTLAQGQTKIDGKVIDSEYVRSLTTGQHLGLSAFVLAEGRAEEAYADLDRNYFNRPRQEIEDALDWLAANRQRLEFAEDSGSVYSLDVPDDVVPKLMPWYDDVPFGILASVTAEFRSRGIKWDEKEQIKRALSGEEGIPGGALYNTVSTMLGGDKAASEFFNSAGIPGIKFPDQVSRSAKDGTSNYVIWDQKSLDRIALLERNGEKMEAMFQASQATGRTENDVAFNPETEAAIEKLFDGVTEDELSRLYGTTAADTLVDARVAHGSDPKTADETLNKAMETVFQAEGGKVDGQKAMRWFYSAAGKFAKKADITSDQAKRMVLEAYGYRHIREVPPDVKVKMARDLESWSARSSTARSKVAMSTEQAKALQAAVIAMNDASPKTLEREALAAGSSAMANGARNGIKWLRSKMIEYVDDRYSIFGKIEKDTNGPLHKLAARLSAGDKKKADVLTSYEKFLKDYMDDHGAFPTDLDTKIDIGGIMMEKSHALAIHTYANAGEGDWKNLYAVQQLVHSNGLTMEQIEAAVKFVDGDPASRRMVDAFQALFARIHGEIAPVYREVTQQDLGKIKVRYLTMMRRNGAVGTDDFMSALQDPAGPNVFRNEQDVEKARLTWMKSRGTEGAKFIGPIDLNFQRNAARYYSQAANYIGSAMAVKDAMTVLSDQGVKESFVRRFGVDGGIYEALTDIIRRDLSYNGRTDPYGSGERWLGSVKNNAYMSLLSYNPFTIANQVLSLPASMAMLPIGDTVTAFTNFSGLLGKAIRRGLTGGSFNVDAGSDYRKDPRVMLMAQKSPQIMRRMTDAVIEEFTETHSTTIGRTGIKVAGKTVASLVEHGTTAMKVVDMIVTASIWHAAYSGQMKIAARRDMSPDLADKAAVAFADDVVRKSQNPSIYAEKGRIQTKNEFYKMLLPFTGQAFAAFKFNYDNFLLPVLEGADNGGGTAGAVKALGRQLTNANSWKKMAFYNIIPAMMFTIIALRRFPDEEEALKGLLLYPALSIPIIGPVLWGAAISGYASGENTLIGGALRGVGTVAKDVTSGRIFSEPTKAIGNFTSAVSYLTGIPQYPRKLIFGVVDEMYNTSLTGKFREDDPLFRLTKENLGTVKGWMAE